MPPSDDATKAVIADIMACLGVETDRSGKPGVSQPKVDQFFAEAQAHSDWWKQAEGDKNILPLGEATAAAFAAVKAVRAKVDDFFARCRVAGFDPRAVAALNRPESEYVALATKESDGQRRRNRQPSARANRRRKSPAAGRRRESRVGRRAGRAASLRRQAAARRKEFHHRIRLGGVERQARAVRGVVRRQGRRGGRETRRQARARNPRGRCKGENHRAHREGQGAGAGSQRHFRRGEAGALSPRPARALPEFRQLQEFLQPRNPGDFPGGAAVSGPARVRPLHHGRGRRQTQRDGRAGGQLSGLLRLRAQGHGRKNPDRRGVHRRRFGQPDGRAQRDFLRPQGPRLGRHHHQAD